MKAKFSRQESGRLGGLANKKSHEHDPSWFSAIGYLGGQTIAEKYDSEHFSKLGKKGSAKRWGHQEDHAAQETL